MKEQLNPIKENIELIGGLIAGITAVIFTLEKLLGRKSFQASYIFWTDGYFCFGLHSFC